MNKYDVSAGYKEEFSKARCLAIANSIIGKKRKLVDLVLLENRIEAKSVGLFFKVSQQVNKELGLRIRRAQGLTVHPFFKDLKFTRIFAKSEEQKLKLEKLAHKKVQLRAQSSEEYDRILEAPSELGQKSQATERPGNTDRDLSFHTASFRSITSREPFPQFEILNGNNLDHDGTSTASIFSMIKDPKNWKKEQKKALHEQNSLPKPARNIQGHQKSTLSHTTPLLAVIRVGRSNINAPSPAARIPRFGQQAVRLGPASKPRASQESETPDLPALGSPKRLEKKLKVVPSLDAKHAAPNHLFAATASRSFHDEVPSPTKLHLQFQIRYRGRPASPVKLDVVDQAWIEAEPEDRLVLRPDKNRFRLHRSLNGQHNDLLVQSRTEWHPGERDSLSHLKEPEQTLLGTQKAKRLRSMDLPVHAEHSKRGKTVDNPSSLAPKKAPPLLPLGRINRKLFDRLQALNEENNSLKKTILLLPPTKKKKLGLLRETANPDHHKTLFNSYLK